MFSPVATTVLNLYPIYWGKFFIQAMSLKDALGLVIQQVLLIIPFLLARRFLYRAEDQRDLMYAFLFGGLLYSLPMLLEIRLSPQLNMWIYGYYQHDFVQTIRFGGYRPMVFLYHGIWAAFYLLMAVLSAYALWKTRQAKSRWKLLLIALYLTAVLVLAKSLGAWLFAAVLVPTIVLFGPRWQMRLAVLIATFAIAYPALKGVDLIPQGKILWAADSIDPERAASWPFALATRTCF